MTDEEKREEINRKNELNKRNQIYTKCAGKRCVIGLHDYVNLRKEAAWIPNAGVVPSVAYEFVYVLEVDVEKGLVQLEDGREVPFKEVASIWPRK